MYCSNCGKSNDDSAKFCYSCGSQINYVKPTEDSYVAPVTSASAELPLQKVTAKCNFPNFIQRPIDFIKKSKLAKIGLAVSAVILLAVLVFFVVMPTIERVESKNALEDFAQAQLNCDAKTLSTYICPDIYQKRLATALEDGKTEDDFIESLENIYTYSVWYGFNSWISDSFEPVGYSINDSHRASLTELNALNAWMTDKMSFKNKATAAVLYEVSIENKSKFDASYSNSTTNYLMCLHFNGNWYIISGIDSWRSVRYLQTLDEVEWVTDWIYSHY